MKRALPAILIVFLLAGCGSTLKQRWTDFNAYYNTYYNAEVSFNRGLRTMESQSYSINPERPIRIHRTPVRAGQADFEKAIQKSADILRDHSQSKWVDDALVLIGKSYFYQGQFFSAEQKFNEVLATSTSEEVRQLAMLWKGLTFLETNRIHDGIVYLNTSINNEDMDWNDQILREVYLVLAQLYVENGDFEEAAAALSFGLRGFRNERLLSRGFFLYGQLLSSLGDLDGAYTAFSNISRRHPEYPLIYHANIKRNAILREQGQYDKAYRNFVVMMRDDKNFDQIGDLNYEIGRTYQFMGESDRAFDTFNNVLYSSIRPPSRETIAKAHYALAELYRYDFYDYRLAAAHYDSASRGVSDRERLPANFNASELARSFGDFSRLTLQIQEADSLLRLGMMPPDEFERTLERIREERLREYERRLRQEQLRGTTVININQGGGSNQSQQGRESGFLNHRNPDLVRQASEAFAAIWDERPLVDNWRRLEAVRRTVVSSLSSNDSPGTSESNADSMEGSIPELNINLSQIPFDADSQQRMRNNIASMSYQIGNVFYINLGMPDSAVYYYQRIVHDLGDVDTRIQAAYSLADIYLDREQFHVAEQYYQILFDEFPEDRITRRMAQRLGRDIEQADTSEAQLARLRFDNLRESLMQSPPDKQIELLEKFSAENTDSTYQDDLIFYKALAYAEIARKDSDFRNAIITIDSLRIDYESRLSELKRQQEAAKSKLEDPELDEISKENFQRILDKTLTPPEFDNYFPYTGQYWDKVRELLGLLISDHHASTLSGRAGQLLAVIELPESLNPKPSSSVEPEPEPEPESESIEAPDDDSGSNNVNPNERQPQIDRL